MTTRRGGDDLRMHESWATVGLTDPFPPGMSVPDEWQRFVVSFMRGTSTDDGYGGFTEGPEQVVLTATATVAMSGRRGPRQSSENAMPPITDRVLTIRLSPVPDPATDEYPRLGDTVMIQGDTMGLPRKAKVTDVVSPLQMYDHVLVRATVGG